MGVTERLARASSLHPWRVLLGWLGAIVVALGLAVTLLPGNLTTEGHVTNNPESAQAERIFYFVPDNGDGVKAAIHHVLDLQTWRSLTVDGGLTRAQAVGLAGGMVSAAVTG